jgi:5'-deoxynucleotidase YfbR-like HD superfamily hydrolase
MLKINIKMAREAGAVRRYHAVRTIKEESVAEHSFNVVNLILILTEGAASRALILAGLTHDMGEYATGDIPSQVKKALPEDVRWDIQKLETDAVLRIHPNLTGGLSADEEYLLHLCDNLDGLLKCIDELKMGNQHIIPVGERYTGYLQDLIEHEPKYRLEVECVISDFRSRYLK